MSTTVNTFTEWYAAPLNGEDMFAGGSLIILTALFVPLYLLVVAVFVKSEREIAGFRYLISMAVADILCMIQFALVNGIAILTKSRLVSEETRHWLQFYMDGLWFVRCFHLPLIAWSRLLAISSPLVFRLQSRRVSYSLCVLVGWLAPFILICATHFQSFNVTFYFEPAVYGFASENLEKYISDGHAQLFSAVNAIGGLLPFVFYGIAIFILLQNRMILRVARNRRVNVEMKLIIPCALSSAIFIIGQAALVNGTGSGKWAAWLICLLFFINSTLQSVLLIVCSEFVRKGAFRIAMRAAGLQPTETFIFATPSLTMKT